MSIFQIELRRQVLQKIFAEWDTVWIKRGFEPKTDNIAVIIQKRKFTKFLNYLYSDIRNAALDAKIDVSNVLSDSHLRRILLNEDNIVDTEWRETTTTGLVVFLGYKSWDDFIEKTQKSLFSKLTVQNYYVTTNKKISWNYEKSAGLVKFEPNDIVIYGKHIEIDEPIDTDYVLVGPSKPIQFNKILAISIGIIASIIAVFFINNWYKHRPFTDSQLSKVKFYFISEYDKPNTSTLKIAYDVSSLNVDSVTVDYGYDEFHLSGTSKIIKNENFTESFTKKIDTISHTYFKPNIWSIKLIANGQVIKKLNKIVYSGKEWTSWASGRENRTLWIGKNVTSNVTMQNGILHYNKKDMEKQGGLDFFYTKHQINHDFKIFGDSATLELRVKNRDNEGGFTNYDTSISFMDSTQSYALVCFVQDCIEYANIVAAKTNMSGKKKVLPFLDTNLQDWRIIKIQLKNKIMTLFLDGENIFHMPYQGTLSEIKGIRVTFKGSGSVDWLKLSNSYNKEIIFFDDFIR